MTKQEDFLCAMMARNSVSASNSRKHKTFVIPANDSRRVVFRDKWRARLISDVPTIQTEDALIRLIVSLSDDLSTEFAEILTGGRLNIGTAQKSVNLYAKYLWCAHMADEPFHCPLDSLIVKCAGERYTWTELDSIDTYLATITKLFAVAKKEGLSLAQWELKKWGTGAE